MPCMQQDDVLLHAKRSIIKAIHCVHFAVQCHSVRLCRVLSIGMLAEWKSHPSQGPTGRSQGRSQLDTHCLNHYSGSCLFKNVVTSFWMCGGTPSCWNITIGLSSCLSGINQNCNMLTFGTELRIISVCAGQKMGCVFNMHNMLKYFFEFPFMVLYVYCMSITFLTINFSNFFC